jgi:hypothetical protein
MIVMAESRGRFAPEARRGRLYVVVETDPEHPDGPHACELVARTVRKAFYADSSYSVTASLREAIRTANEALYKHNFQIPVQRRAHVGISCGVLKDNDIFLAQVAPAQAYVISAGHLRALPTHPSWHAAHSSATPFVQPSALGSSLFVDPELYRCRWQPGDTLLLCSSNLARLLSSEQTRATLRQPDADGAIEHLYTLCEQHEVRDAHAIAIRLQQPLPAVRKPRQSSGLLGGAASPWQRLTTWLMSRVRATGESRPADEEPEAPEAPARPTAETFEPPPLTPPFPPKPQPIDIGEELQERREREDAERLPPSAFLGEGGYPEHEVPAESGHPIDLSGLDDLAGRVPEPFKPRHERRPVVDMSVGERVLLPFSRLGSFFQSRPTRRPLRPPRPRPTPHRGQYFGQAPPRAGFPWMLVVLMLLVLVLVLYGINVSNEDTSDRTVAYLEEAEQRIALVYEAPDSASAAERLEGVSHALSEVRSSPLVTETNAALWLRYQELRSDYEQAQASIYLINYLQDAELISEHPLPGGRFADLVVPPATTSLTTTFAQEAISHVYALDGNIDVAQLYRIPREGGRPEPYLSPNQVVRNTVVGPVRGTAWRINNVIAIDQGNNGFGYYLREGNSWNYIRLGGSEIWAPRGRLDLETYQGNLYVWGAETNEILKFDSGRYGDIPSLWINPAGLAGYDISASIDMAIDGYIYLLQPDGHVAVMNLGNFEREIVPGEISPPIRAVTRFFVTGTPDQGWIFLLDAFNERVVQIDKTSGEVMQQLRLSPGSGLELNQLTDLHVDTSTARPQLYLVNGGQIITAELPNPPVPFTPDNADEAPDDSASPNLEAQGTTDEP